MKKIIIFIIFFLTICEFCLAMSKNLKIYHVIYIKDYSFNMRGIVFDKDTPPYYLGKLIIKNNDIYFYPTKKDYQNENQNRYTAKYFDPIDLEVDKIIDELKKQKYIDEEIPNDKLFLAWKRGEKIYDYFPPPRKGNILKKFQDIKNADEMILDEKFTKNKKIIFNVLKHDYIEAFTERINYIKNNVDRASLNENDNSEKYLHHYKSAYFIAKKKNQLEEYLKSSFDKLPYLIIDSQVGEKYYRNGWSKSRGDELLESSRLNKKEIEKNRGVLGETILSIYD